MVADHVRVATNTEYLHEPPLVVRLRLWIGVHLQRTAATSVVPSASMRLGQRFGLLEVVTVLG